jgi:hypothetical protein
MRDVTLLRRPVGAPGVCGKCGSQNRLWFLDLGFDLEFLPHGNGYYTEGVVYLCNECVRGLVADVNRRWAAFADNDPDLQRWEETNPFDPPPPVGPELDEDIVEFTFTES